MTTLDLFAAAGVRRGGTYRVVEQVFRYEGGRAVAYRCPDCNDWHPLNPRDWDEARRLYAGRDCGRVLPLRANSPEGRRLAERARFPSAEAHRAWRTAYKRAWRERRAEAARRAAQGAGGPR